MDSLDAGIIREFSAPGGSHQWNVRHPYSVIAKKFGVDDETVRRRIRAAERSGLILGSELIVNPQLIARDPVGLYVTVAGPEQRKRTVISQLKLIGGVVSIIDFQGEGLQLLMYSQGAETPRKIGLISSLSGDSSPITLSEWQALGFRRCNLKLTKNDLMIIKSLRRDPRKSVHQVALEMSISARTVERRLDALTSRYAFFHMFRVDFAKLDGVVCSVQISYQDETSKRGLDRTMESKLGRIIYSVTSGSATSMYNFVCSNVPEAEMAHEWIRSLGGVTRTRMGIIKDFILVSDWLDDELEGMFRSLH